LFTHQKNIERLIRKEECKAKIFKKTRWKQSIDNKKAEQT
jgi:hypothetical protein